ncbi:hypothetical protein B0H13DRAFT_1919293 [Mycena leptocephala]|nr:hypothetical protein B0H13DRAFT_1919293 [Mycena leptocephala]
MAWRSDRWDEATMRRIKKSAQRETSSSTAAAVTTRRTTTRATVVGEDEAMGGGGNRGEAGERRGDGGGRRERGDVALAMFAPTSSLTHGPRHVRPLSPLIVLIDDCSVPGSFCILFRAAIGAMPKSETKTTQNRQTRRDLNAISRPTATKQPLRPRPGAMMMAGPRKPIPPCPSDSESNSESESKTDTDNDLEIVEKEREIVETPIVDPIPRLGGVGGD